MCQRFQVQELRHRGRDLPTLQLASVSQHFSLSNTSPTLTSCHSKQCFRQSSKGPIKFYDRICAPVKLTPPTATTSISAGTSAAGTSTAGVDIGGTITNPSIQTTDSPPLASSAVVFPTEDKSFTATYTYEDDPLPTIAAMGTSPLENGLQATESGLPDLPCVLDPSSTTEQFNILGSDFVPLVSTRGALVPLPSPTSEAQAKAMGPAAQLSLPAFAFQKPANAPSGVYDIVLVGSTPQYLAKTAQGGLVLTGSSTGATQVRRNNQNIITSIFGVDCKGRITVTQSGTSYVWDVSGATTKFTTGTAEKRMVTYSLRRAATVDRSRTKRRSIYTEGAAPRCPNSPPNLVAKVFPKARGLAPNGCGAANGFDFVPDFSFGSCCDDHDNCFDNCEKGSFESCNKDFGRCMRTRGCDYLNHWYSYVPYVSCLLAADFYEWSVGTSIGRKAFYSSNKERCGCYCSSADGLCGRGDEGYSCTSMFGDDVNNCGACGRTCSAKASCKKGSCACPNDQCGDRCVSLKTHPKNCGSCGNVCASGYCFQGQCYDPPADKCVAASGFPNGFSACEYVLGTPGFGNDCYPSIEGSKISMEFAGAVTASVFTRSKVCPGQRYELSFTLNPSEALAGSGTCIFKYRFADRQWSQTFEIPKGRNLGSTFGNPGTATRQGPFDVDGFQEGESGVSKSGLGLEVPFEGSVVCTTPAVTISLQDFELVPQQ